MDCRTASQGEAILVRHEALRLRDEEHLPAHAIVAELEQLKQRIRVLAVVDSLKHLHKGGRLPAAVALVGGALGVKPVLSVVDGQIKLADTARGRPGAFVAMFKNIEKMGGVDPRYGYALLYSDEKGVLAPLHHYMHENLHMTGGRVARLGPVIASHAGPGCAGLVFVDKRVRAIPHNSKCRYGERGVRQIAKPKAQIILDVLSSIFGNADAVPAAAGAALLSRAGQEVCGVA